MTTYRELFEAVGDYESHLAPAPDQHSELWPLLNASMKTMMGNNWYKREAPVPDEVLTTWTGRYGAMLRGASAEQAIEAFPLEAQADDDESEADTISFADLYETISALERNLRDQLGGEASELWNTFVDEMETLGGPDWQESEDEVDPAVAVYWERFYEAYTDQLALPEAERVSTQELARAIREGDMVPDVEPAT